MNLSSKPCLTDRAVAGRVGFVNESEVQLLIG